MLKMSQSHKTQTKIPGFFKWPLLMGTRWYQKNKKATAHPVPKNVSEVYGQTVGRNSLSKTT